MILFLGFVVVVALLGPAVRLLLVARSMVWVQAFSPRVRSRR